MQSIRGTFVSYQNWCFFKHYAKGRGGGSNPWCRNSWVSSVFNIEGMIIINWHPMCKKTSVLVKYFVWKFDSYRREKLILIWGIFLLLVQTLPSAAVLITTATGIIIYLMEKCGWKWVIDNWMDTEAIENLRVRSEQASSQLACCRPGDCRKLWGIL